MFEIVDKPQTSSKGVKPVCAIAEYDPIVAALATLSEKYGKVVFDVSTKVGLKSAESARAELRGYRTNLESTRKAIKNPALERCRLIDAEAKDITEKLTALEKPIAAQIEAEEARKEAEKQAKLQVEIQRVTKLRERIAAFTQLVDTIEPKADACQAEIVRMKAILIDDTFEELQPDAQQAKDAAMFRLQNLFAQYTASEAEAEQIRIDRAKLAQLEAESAARRAEDDRKAAEERARLAAEQEERLFQERQEALRVVEATCQEQVKKDREIEAQQAEQRRQQDEQARQVREAQQTEQKRLDAIAAELRQKQEDAAEAERQRLAAVNAADDQVHKAAPLLLEALDNLISVYIRAVYDSEEDARKDSPPALVKAWKASAIAKGKNYFSEDGTLMNADGTRSIFDDVDQ